jgi:hypothetical protein
MAEKRCVYKLGAWNCGSYQFNLYKDDIDQSDLCDVHYWQTKAQRPWQGLTDEDKQTAVWTNGTFGGGALWAEAMLKELNHG